MPVITATQFESNFMTLFNTFWNGRTPIAGVNIDFERDKVPAAQVAFLEYSFLGVPDGELRLSDSIANNIIRREGTVTFLINTREEQNNSVSLDLIEAIGQFFNRAVLPQTRLFGAGTPIPLGSDGAWFQQTLSSSWQYFTEQDSSPIV